jgi:phosphate transport system permease protein
MREIDLRKKRRLDESMIQAFLAFCGALSILTTVGIVFVLGQEALLFFRLPAVSFWDFLTKVKWQPAIGEFGIWPLVFATLITSFMAMLVALPIGLMIAIYLSEYASPRARNILKPVLEVLAGVPTVVYGYFALTFMTPLVRSIFVDISFVIYLLC